MSIKFKVNATFKGPWLKTKQLFEKLPDIIMKAGEHAIIEGSKFSKERYKDNYKQGKSKAGSIAPLTKDTLVWRRTGKLPGTGQTRTPWSVPISNSSTPLNRTGSIAKAIRRRVHKGKGGLSFTIDINPAKKNPEGKSIAQIVEAMEVQRRVTFNVTHKMQAYLLILFGKAVGKGGGKPKSIQPTGKQITIVYPARPLWALTETELTRELPDKLQKWFMEGFKKQGVDLG